jgi:3,4-dihydroxy 2-butanone 4-phosphate synthase / GTP cyclohydrolase II
MNDDGTMARMPDLVRFAQYHHLKIGTIADLIAYRLRHDRIVERILETALTSIHGGTFGMFVYVNRIAYAEHIALVKGDLGEDGPVLVRMHALNVLDDVLGDTRSGKTSQLHDAMRMIGALGRGVVVLIREPHKSSLSDRVRALINDTSEETPQLRDYGIGAQILLDLGVKEMILLSNTARTLIGFEGFGLRIVDRHPICSQGVNNEQ